MLISLVVWVADRVNSHRRDRRATPPARPRDWVGGPWVPGGDGAYIEDLYFEFGLD